MLTKKINGDVPTLAPSAVEMMRQACRTFTAETRGPWRLDQSEFMQGRQDGTELAFVARQLEFLRPGLYDIKYPDLIATQLMPWNTAVGNGAEQYTVTVVDQRGEVKVSRDFASDTPMVEILTSQGSIPLYSYKLGYQYSIQEGRAALQGGFPLNARKAIACRDQIERKMDDIAFVGDKTSGILGLLTQSGTEVYTVPADGTGASKTFDSKSSDDVLRDLNAPSTQMVTDTFGIEIPDTMVLPLSTYNLLATRRIGDGTSETILRYFLDNSPFIQTVAQSYKTETAPASQWTGKRGVVFKKDASKFEMIMSQPFEQWQPTYSSGIVTTICHARTAGVALYVPKSVSYFDGI